MSYEGIFFRDFLGQTQPDIPTTNWSVSPDIIPTGPVPLADPAACLMQYNSDLGQPLALNQINYIYVRGVNYSSNPASALVSLFAVPNTLDQWPTSWEPLINIATQGPSVEVTNAPLGKFAVNPPFLWIPPALPEDASAYCLIAIAQNLPVRGGGSLLPPSPIPDLRTYVTTNPNVGWRSTLVTSGSPPTAQFYVPISWPSESMTAYIGLCCRNVPPDSRIAMTAPGPDAANTVIVPTQPVLNPNLAIFRPVTWPAGYATSLIASWWQGTTPWPSNASLQAVILLPTTSTGILRDTILIGQYTLQQLG